MLGNVEYVFGGMDAWGPPDGGPADCTIQHTVFWPGGSGILLVESLDLANGATLRLNLVSTGLGGNLSRLGTLEVDVDITEPNHWYFTLPAGSQIGFVVTLPAADVEPPGHAVVSMTIQRTEP